MSKLKKLLREVNKHLEAAAIAEMRIDVARQTLLGNEEAITQKRRSPKKAASNRPVFFDELPMLTDNKLFPST
ncbi:MAG: hypothetical protein L7F77_01350 [Candidatus Magnetominusculus sp. LBB02]|nr:hypothetical protein [Candidatus Magnetominusculus sp. LBB02]